MDLDLLKRELLYRGEELRFRLGAGPRDGSIPHACKRDLIGRYRRHHALHCCVETGTYLGDMTAVLARQFEEVHSIELSPDLFERASHRFRSRPRVRLYQGDSAEVLPRVVAGLTQPALFWLDAHYSGGVTARSVVDSPILNELECVLSDRRFRHVVLVDDARCFNGSGGYPTLMELRERATRLAPECFVECADDVIRLTPGERP